MKALRRFLAGPATSGEPRLPDGYRLYAVGDVHGRDDLLVDLLAMIEADSSERRPAKRIIVFLGDLIDRGPASSAVVERLRTYRPADTHVIFLAGNHEEVLLRILDGDEELVADWLRFGGAECIRSYGVDPGDLRRMSPERAIEIIRSAIPAAHAEFLRGFDDTFRAGDYLFVHAGIRPGVPLAAQARSDLRWIREPFLTDRAEHGFIVVHGHTIRKQIEDCGNRIGIDTGAYRFGVLSALGLESTDRWYLQAPLGNSGPGGNRSTSSALDAVSSQSG
ncbi:MAG TPA: metallophosphoesterase [Sphingomicrobium sp.]|nr:metallophosphoesterase [Sphingomicrobium sp.]